MVETFIGRNPAARNTNQQTTKDALVVLKTLQMKLVRVTAKSRLVLNPEDQDLVEGKGGKAQQTKIFTRMAEEIALEIFKVHEELNVTGMIYFNISSGEMLQVLEGKPSNLSQALRHVVRDIKQDDLNFQLEKDKVIRRFKKWGMAFATNIQEWKIIRLMIPSEEEWERLRPNLDDVKNRAKGVGRRNSLVDLIEAKRPILERFGPDAKRIWKRRGAISTAVLSPAELRFFRQRHEMAKRELQTKAHAHKKGGLLACIEDPDGPIFPDKISDLEEGVSGGDRPSKIHSTSGSRSRISLSRSNVIERMQQEVQGFVETIDDIAVCSKHYHPSHQHGRRRRCCGAISLPYYFLSLKQLLSPS
eukprot:jgi/Bigna1/68072/fgenesh1_pg.5_\